MNKFSVSMGFPEGAVSSGEAGKTYNIIAENMEDVFKKVHLVSGELKYADRVTIKQFKSMRSER